MAVFLKINFGGKNPPQNTEAKKLYCNSSTVLVLFFYMYILYQIVPKNDPKYHLNDKY